MYKMYKYKMYKYKCTNIPVIVYKCYLLKFILDFTTIYITFLQANNFIGVIYFFFLDSFNMFLDYEIEKFTEEGHIEATLAFE